MARDGGFALVSSGTQALANQLLAAFAGGVSPQSVSLPTINVGGTPVSLRGSIALLPPVVTFRNRTDNFISTTLAVGGLFTLTTASQSASLVNVVLSTTLDVPLSTSVLNNQIIASVDLSQITVNQLEVQFLQAPPSPIFQSAVASPAVDAAITTFLRSMPALPVTVPLMSSSINESVSRGVPPGMDPSYHIDNRSVFPPYPARFTISLSTNRVVLRQFDGAITVAADLVGITTGDPTQLVDLTSTYSPLCSLLEVQSYDHSYSSYSAGGGVPQTSAVVLINPAVLTSVLANQVSPRLDDGPLLDTHVLAHNVTAALGWFDAGAPYGTGTGITLTLSVSYYSDRTEDADGYYWPSDAVHVPANVTLYLKVVGVEPYSGPGAWDLQLVNVDVSLPTWLALDLVTISIASLCLGPVLTVIAAAIDEAAGAILRTLLDKADNTVLANGNELLGAAQLPMLQTVSIPGTNISAHLDIRNYGFSSEGPELWIDVSAYDPSHEPAGQAVQVIFEGNSVSLGSSSATIVYSAPSLDVQVQVAADFPDPSVVYVQWSVVRSDTGAQVFSTLTHYSDPGGDRISVPRNTVALQAVNHFSIGVTVIFPGQVFSYTIDVTINDWLDRSHRFVKWVSRTWFRDPSKPRQWLYYWQRTRASRIHRTDSPGRCLRLSPPAWILETWQEPGAIPHPLTDTPLAQFVPEQWVYLDALPFATAKEAIDGRRGVLCDYCFFGGPSKNVLLVSVP
jgi:hypothetical protein